MLQVPIGEQEHLQEFFRLCSQEGREQASQIPRITKKAEDCYVRAGIAIDGRKEVECPLSLDDISGVGDSWIYCLTSYSQYYDVMILYTNI